MYTHREKNRASPSDTPWETLGEKENERGEKNVLRNVVEDGINTCHVTSIWGSRRNGTHKSQPPSWHLLGSFGMLVTMFHLVQREEKKKKQRNNLFSSQSDGGGKKKKLAEMRGAIQHHLGPLDSAHLYVYLV